MDEHSPAKTAMRWTALCALFLIPLTPLLVFNSFFFPFITGKAFFFRILVEIAVASWLVLAFLDRRYRPRFSWVGLAVLAFVLWMFIADAFAINAAKAFWSNFERMEGWVLLIHLLGFFYAASAVLRETKKWRAWFLTSLAVSLVVSGYALLQLAGVLTIHQGSSRIDATFGNSAYLAIYLLFNVFIALWLALTEKYTWLKWSLMALAVLEGILLLYTETRGTVIGLTVGLGLAALLTAFTAGKRARSFAVGALAVLVLFVGSFYLARNSSFVQGNHVLQRIASISLSDGQTRFTLWHMAFEGVTERPILGWGQEGFNYVFNKYYDPSLYRQEQWFDRAHNAFIDWIIAGGIPAFLLYFSLFGTAIVLLWKNSELSRPERIAITAALIGYAIHNLFVFDNLYSYVYFFALLALIDSQVARPIQKLETAPEFSADEGMTYALPIAAVSTLVLVWLVNLRGMSVASELIQALSSQEAGISSNIALFQGLTARPAFAEQEIREQLVSFAGNIAQSQAPADVKQQVLTLAITEMQKQVAAYPLDAREHLELSFAYRAAGDEAKALEEIKAALLQSPKKIEILIEAGATEWDLGDVKGAQQDFNTAYTLGGSRFANDLAVYAAGGDYAAGDITDGDKILISTYGTTNVDSDILSIAYYQAKNWPRLISLWRSRISQPNASAQTWFSLAGAYYASKDVASALAVLKEAVTLYPEAASSAAAAISQLQGK